MKARNPALEATNLLTAWNWLSSSAIDALMSPSWESNAVIALFISFSLFSEKRP